MTPKLKEHIKKQLIKLKEGLEQDVKDLEEASG